MASATTVAARTCSKSAMLTGRLRSVALIALHEDILHLSTYYDRCQNLHLSVCLVHSCCCSTLQVGLTLLQGTSAPSVEQHHFAGPVTSKAAVLLSAYRSCSDVLPAMAVRMHFKQHRLQG